MQKLQLLLSKLIYNYVPHIVMYIADSTISTGLEKIVILITPEKMTRSW